ncbi:hypothetical protein Niako_1095 [Niastella koreensis GR20-10]|uniref:Uncharacterized protein n=1 Tax=Niastella koreensis (strain DSM 17620 / KACC 11465 / NBRC 106392 / GR20-10) TaxID=700598 RepID=G8THP3_NIAKG|nr:hypothetical protein [Niastella koreensis]AEV97471.1 hypothetical protein Niako_1095 [Niastella koreensis GR20-10]
MKHIKKGKQTSVVKRVYPKAAKDYVNDPYFVKKREMASEFLKKAGLPESFKNIEN